MPDSRTAQEPTRIVERAGDAAVVAAAAVWAEATAARDSQPRPALEVAEQVLRAVLVRHRSMLLLAVCGPAVVGFAATAGTDEADLAELHYLGVRPDAWGRGIGASILAALPAHLRQRSFDRARLVVYVDNARARTLYERHGWVAQGAPSRHARSGRLEQQLVLGLQSG